MEINDDIIQLVVARLNTMPDHLKMHLGMGNEAYDKEELIKHVKKQDEFGKKFVRLQMDYIKATIHGFR